MAWNYGDACDIILWGYMSHLSLSLFYFPRFFLLLMAKKNCVFCSRRFRHLIAAKFLHGNGCLLRSTSFGVQHFVRGMRRAMIVQEMLGIQYLPVTMDGYLLLGFVRMRKQMRYVKASFFVVCAL